MAEIPTTSADRQTAETQTETRRLPMTKVRMRLNEAFRQKVFQPVSPSAIWHQQFTVLCRLESQSKLQQLALETLNKRRDSADSFISDVSTEK